MAILWTYIDLFPELHFGFQLRAGERDFISVFFLDCPGTGDGGSREKRELARVPVTVGGILEDFYCRSGNLDP